MKIFLRDTIILIVLMLIDIFTFYYYDSYFNLIFKPLFTGYLAWRFYQYISHPVSRKNKLVLISLGVTFSGEILFLFRESQMVSVILILVYLIEHQMYITIFREDNARLNNLFKKKNFIISIPFILTCFFFFGALMMPNIPDNFLLLGIIYCVQLSLLTALSVARDTNKKSYVLVLFAMVLLMLSDAATSYNLFLDQFPLDYAVIRFLFLGSKLFFVIGMYYSYTANHLDKEYT